MEKQLHILLADDDEDDRYFFSKALEKLTIPTQLTTVVDGEKLMIFLTKKTEQPPDVLFLDINMPRKKGNECLMEIKNNKTLKDFPVIIYSTHLDNDLADEFYKMGAHYYMQKGEFSDLTKHLQYLLQLLIKKEFKRPTREAFIIHQQEVL